MADINPQTVLITGASSGFGYETAVTAASHGHTVIATMRNTGAGNAGAASLLKGMEFASGGTVLVHELDVADPDQTATLMRVIAETTGVPDVLINNAATFMYGPAEAFDDEQSARNFSINTLAPLRLCQAVLPGMRKRGSGLIIQISSGAGRLVFPGMSLYGASKAALEYLSEAMYYELLPLGIDMAIVQPGMYKTAALGKLEGPKRREHAEKYPHVDKFQSALGAHAESYFGSGGGDSSEVVGAVIDLIEMPGGTRPLRTVVGPDIHSVHDANVLLQTPSSAFISGFGMDVPPPNRASSLVSPPRDSE